MSNIYVRIPHYIASFLRNRDAETSIPAGTPLKIESGDPLFQQVILHAVPNLRNDVSVLCFSERQWVAMRQGKMLAYSDAFMLDRNRDARRPLTLSEVYSFCGRQDLVRTIETEDGIAPAPDSEYPDEYVPFELPSRIVRSGREEKIQSDWYLSNAKDFVAILRNMFKMAFVRFVAEDRKVVHSLGLERSKMESIDRFMLRYDIRTGEREREQLKKLLTRSRAAALYSLDADDEHGRWSGESIEQPTGKRGRPKRAVFCLDNGVTYESVTEFAKAFGIKYKSTVTLAIQNHHRCKGMSICYADSIHD